MELQPWRHKKLQQNWMKILRDVFTIKFEDLQQAPMILQNVIFIYKNIYCDSMQPCNRGQLCLSKWSYDIL